MHHVLATTPVAHVHDSGLVPMTPVPDPEEPHIHGRAREGSPAWSDPSAAWSFFECPQCAMRIALRSDGGPSLALGT